MNTIELRLEPGTTPGGPVVHIRIDGRDLIDRIRAIELPQATGDGQPELAGSYGYLEPGDWPDVREGKEELVTVLGCDCGVVECWPLRARMRRRGGVVVWSHFQQPNRGWTYERLGPFTFREAEYDRAVASVAKHVA